MPVQHYSNSISVIISTAGRPERLYACLKAVSRQSVPPEEILVVDRSPEDFQTRFLVGHFFPGCRYIADKKRGIQSPRNHGVKRSHGRIIAFVDDDGLPAENWIEVLKRNFDLFPKAGCCTGPVRARESTTPLDMIGTRGTFSRGGTRRVFDLSGKKSVAGTYPLQSYIFGTGANMAFRRSTLKAIGGFDENMGRGEDMDIFFRTIVAGFKLIYEPKAVVFHQFPEGTLELRSRYYQWGKGYAAFLLKVAMSRSIYRKKAWAELKNWLLGFQLRERMLKKMTGRDEFGFPLNLILAEIAGGLNSIIVGGVLLNIKIPPLFIPPESENREPRSME